LRCSRCVRRSFNAAGVREGFALDVAAHALRARLDELAALSVTGGWWNASTGLTDDLSGPQVLLLLSALHRRARRLTGVDAPILRLPGDCPHCCARSLRRREDNPEWIWCASCGGQLTRSEYQRLLHVTHCDLVQLSPAADTQHTRH
jgi:hypothetical protein